MMGHEVTRPVAVTKDASESSGAIHAAESSGSIPATQNPFINTRRFGGEPSEISRIQQEPVRLISSIAKPIELLPWICAPKRNGPLE